MERKIQHSTINNKWAKINIGGVGIRGKIETKKSPRDVYRNGKWFWNNRGRGNTKSEENKPD